MKTHLIQKPRWKKGKKKRYSKYFVASETDGATSYTFLIHLHLQIEMTPARDRDI